MFQKKKYFIGIVVLLLWLVGCATPTADETNNNLGKQEEIIPTQKVVSEEKNTPILTLTPTKTATLTSIPAPTSTPTPVSIPDFSLKEMIIESGGEIYIDGESYNAVWGETGALIWKYVDATFDVAPHILTTFIVSESPTQNMRVMDSEKNIYRTGWLRWFDLVDYEFTINSVGADMFSVYLVNENKESVYINGREKLTFSVSSINLPFRYAEDDRYMLSHLDRQNKFCDGYAIMKVYYEDYSVDKWSSRSRWESLYIWIDTYGNYSYLDIEKCEEESKDYMVEHRIYQRENYYSNGDVGSYSDGVFYYAGSFYDFEMNKVLDLADSGYTPYSDRDIYSPQFIDGICRMVAFKNNEFWVFDIDKMGEIISEPEKIDILWLSY